MEMVNECAEVYEDALEIIPKLKRKGFKLAIVTNSIFPPYEKFEKKYENFLKQFDAVVKSFEIETMWKERKTLVFVVF